MNAKKKLALFDFDGTITNCDSFRRFISYSIERRNLIKGYLLLLPEIILYGLGFVSNEEAKQKIFKYFFSGWTLNEIEIISESFAKDILPHICKKNLVERIRWHKNNNHRVVIVSASFECYLKYFSNSVSAELLGTQIEILNGMVTGNFLSKNCYGPEKVNRIVNYLDPHEYYIYSYGDSQGDQEMFQIADEAYLVKGREITRI